MGSKYESSQIDMFSPKGDDGTWKPPSSFPNIPEGTPIWTDCETSGKNKQKDKPCGLAIAVKDAAWYFPYRHLGGGNMDEEQVKRFARDVHKKRLVGNINMGFDAEVMLNDGIDLEAGGCTIHDIAHAAALIDEKRFKGANLEELWDEYFPDTPRTKIKHGVEPKDIHRVHSSLIGPYAINDIEMARDVDIFQRPLIARDDLEEVEALENELMWPNNHMERCGMRMDMDKLHRWQETANDEYADKAMRIWLETGIKLKPNAPTTWHDLFTRLGLKTPDYEKTKKDVKRSQGKNAPVSLMEVDVIKGFDEAFLKNVDHDLVRSGLRMRRLSSLKSKYLDKYAKQIGAGDILRYHLYQLRAAEEDYGTVVGRYSSANVNIQQVFKPSNQADRFCDCGAAKDAEHQSWCFGLQYVIRELMICDPGMDMFATDGSQLQFRLFAHFSKDPDLIRAYCDDPTTDFHTLVSKLFDLTRQAAKHNNFAMVLGMGREKLADRLGKSCTCKDWTWWSRTLRQRMDRDQARQHIFGKNANHAQRCPARESNDLADRYEAQFPAAKNTMEAVTNAAKGIVDGEPRVDHAGRGYVRCVGGRRLRYVEGDKFYSAFAGLLQGSEATVVKRKICTLYRERKNIGVTKIRVTNHDEIVGDISKDPEDKKRFEAVCAQQEYELKVPIVWNAGYGANWKDCH